MTVGRVAGVSEMFVLRYSLVFSMTMASLFFGAPSWGQEIPEPRVPRLIPPRTEVVRWERFGHIREGKTSVGTFLYSADLSFSAEGEPSPSGPRAARLLLEVETSHEPKSVLRLVFYQQDAPAGGDEGEGRVLAFFGDPESGQWLAWRRRTPVGSDQGGAGGDGFVLFETASWRSSWVSEGSPESEVKEAKLVEEWVPELLEKLRRIRPLLPNENRAFPDYFQVTLERLAKVFSWPESAGAPTRRYEVLDKRVARGEAREKPLAADFERRFGPWSQWNRLPAKLKLLF